MEPVKTIQSRETWKADASPGLLVRRQNTSTICICNGLRAHRGAPGSRRLQRVLLYPIKLARPYEETLKRRANTSTSRARDSHPVQSNCALLASSKAPCGDRRNAKSADCHLGHGDRGGYEKN